jgi:hypothetical protein
LIYGKDSGDRNEVQDDDAEMMYDTLRYDVNPIKLNQYAISNFKKLLKKKFVTGIAKDKVLENLLNMSDSDEEGKDQDGKPIDKDQIRRLEDNERKGTKFDKKRKRMENKGFKVETDSDEASEDIDGESGDEEKFGVKKEKVKKMEQSKEHKPM